MVAHCSTRAMVVPYAINIMSKRQLRLDRDACGNNSMISGG
jgi:hypothetical protein